MTFRKKLIEVALPLDAINVASAREKSIRHGHPSTLHLWWARRPLAAARAVIFAQMVDDPSAWPDLFPTEKAQEKERKRLFKIIEELVLWENTTNEEVLQKARNEIWRSWRRTCADNADHPRAKELFDRHKLPAFHDPFAGGGSLPLEAQRLGLEAYASDLNPVAVLINKAMIEIPPKFAGRPPVNPEARKEKSLIDREWKGAQGLAEDVRYYGKWMRDEAEKRIGHLYPKVEITKEIVKERPDLKPYVGQKLTVIAWLWARTVKSPNPAFAQYDVPLISNFLLSSKSGKEAYVEPVVHNTEYRFKIRAGKPKDITAAKTGTKVSRGSFRCLLSDSPILYQYIDEEANAGRMGTRLMAIVADAGRQRVLIDPTPEHEATVYVAEPSWKPDAPSRGTWASNAQGRKYGFVTFGDYFTRRQLVALNTFSDLVIDARALAQRDASAFGLPDSKASSYAETIQLYLSIALSRLTDICNSMCRWEASKTQVRNLFGRQAIPMMWDFAENNVFAAAAGDYLVSLLNMAKALDQLPATGVGMACQADAQTQSISIDKLVSTDPPYYDNIGYADLSDFFYVWLRRSLRSAFPELFTTLAVPKAEELVAESYRHGSRDAAEQFFLHGMTNALTQLAVQTHPAFPVTIYYAFKQSESETETGSVSTGWETFLDALIQAGFDLSGTWPMRTELANRMVGSETNVLASSIILVCRRRTIGAPVATRREFANALKAELPAALAHLQRGNIAPVDLAQSAIGPGMAVFTRYGKVIDAKGEPLSVREALSLINEALDEVQAEQEGDFDAETRWALAWYEQHSFNHGEYGIAETLSKAKNTSVGGMADAGILVEGRGKVRLLKPAELPDDWDPVTDTRLTVWEIVHHMIRVLESGGEAAAAGLLAKIGSKSEVARELAYRLYTICQRKKRATEALSYNQLVQSWPEIARLAREGRSAQPAQAALFEEA